MITLVTNSMPMNFDILNRILLLILEAGLETVVRTEADLKIKDPNEGKKEGTFIKCKIACNLFAVFVGIS